MQNSARWLNCTEWKSAFTIEFYTEDRPWNGVKSDGLLENADTDAGQRTPDKRWKRRTTMEKTDNDGKDGQMMEKTDKRWKRRTNDGKDGQTMEKTDKRWKRRTNDGKDGQTMEKIDAFSNRPTFHEYIGSNVGLCHIYC